MKNFLLLNRLSSKLPLFLFLLSSSIGYTQIMQVNVLGGAQITNGSTLTITAGTAVTFRITNTSNNCSSLRVKDVNISNITDFSINPNNPRRNIKSSKCRRGRRFLDFTITNSSANCTSSSTLVTIKSNKADFTFTLTVNKSPVISVSGGSPLTSITNGATTTSTLDGTYFGIVEAGFTQTRRFYITNTGSCPLDITNITSSLADFVISFGPFPSSTISPGSSSVFDITFTANLPAETKLSNITIVNTDTTFTFNVSAEIFNFNIPEPGGITADFRLWLKANRGVIHDSGNKVSEWKDIGTNGKNASQPTSANQPTYIDDATSNINFNPVIKFENNGTTIEQYMENTLNGFYSQDIFIVMIPDETISSATQRRTIFSGTDTGNLGDKTGIGFGNYTNRFNNEVLTYAQDVESPSGTFYGIAEIDASKTYTNAGIINIRNDADPANNQELLYNSKLITTSIVNDTPPFSNVTTLDNSTTPATIIGKPYIIGKNFDSAASLNGRVAEIFTFAKRVLDADRPKIESYLAIKYGITLGSSTIAEKNYINSNGNVLWDITANTGYNFNIAGIGRDDTSDLNQKQSKSINDINEVTIGLGEIFSTNSANTNGFSLDHDFLVWGCNNGNFSGSNTNTNTITISTGITTSLTRIDRKWKIIETGGDVGNVYISIPESAFSGFPINANEEYSLVVSDVDSFSDADIIDVIPLKSDGNGNLKTWYDFDGTKFFTFGKTTQLTGKRLVNIAAGDFLVGEYKLDLNINAFTISTWVRNTTLIGTRTILAKGKKLQLRLNNANEVEVMLNDEVTPKFTSTMQLTDSKWHHIALVYESGTIFLYIDGILDKSVLNVEPPTPNFNRFSAGALYESKNTISNPFLGEIDEIRVWDVGLSQDQIHYLMNQEMEKFTDSTANGKEIPQAISKNEVKTINWSNLRAYYNFNSFYGSTVEGQTDLRNFLRINYLSKNKTIVDLQTAPLPYISQADGNWDTPGTWLNNTVQNLPNTVGLDGVTSLDWNIVQTTHLITSGDRDITVLGFKMNAGKLTMADPLVTNPIENNDGQGLRVTHYLELDGVLDLVGESQLVQDEDSTLDEDSGGYILRDQQGTASSYNYNYWTSSVGPINGNVSTRGVGSPSVNSPSTVAGFLKDGTDATNPDKNGQISFNASYIWADAGVASPIKLSIYWMYTFNGANDDYNAWNSINETTPLLPGEGFTMKGTSGTAAITDNQNYVFKGKPYNGDFILPIALGEDRLIGNPYPSAMDADEFILDNIKETINFNQGRNVNNIFNGALYFWHHFAGKTHYLAEYEGGYATYTLMGGTQAYSTDTRINATGASGNKVPERYIPVNQGFFVTTSLDVALDSTTTTVSGGDIVFKNGQRVFVREGATGINEGSLFFKSNSKSESNKTERVTDKRSKIRLQFSSSRGYHRQLLVGVDSHATNDYDIGFDAPMADMNSDDMFWLFKGGKFVIQAVNNFDVSQELPIGIKLKEDGLVTIKIDSLENVDKSVEIYIKDNFTGLSHQINNQPFEINLPVGEYKNRFALTFQPQKTLGVEEKTLENGIQVFMNNTISELQIRRNKTIEIKSINLLNNLGQVIGSWNSKLTSNEILLPIKAATGIYLVQINTKTGKLSKKILIN